MPVAEATMLSNQIPNGRAYSWFGATSTEVDGESCFFGNAFENMNFVTKMNCHTDA